VLLHPHLGSAGPAAERALLGQQAAQSGSLIAIEFVTFETAMDTALSRWLVCGLDKANASSLSSSCHGEDRVRVLNAR